MLDFLDLAKNFWFQIRNVTLPHRSSRMTTT